LKEGSPGVYPPYGKNGYINVEVKQSVNSFIRTYESPCPVPSQGFILSRKICVCVCLGYYEEALPNGELNYCSILNSILPSDIQVNLFYKYNAYIYS
jgi:hypothetical protein